MRKGDDRSNREVLRLCRKIGKRGYNLKELQPLVFQLQEALRQASCETQTLGVMVPPRAENPFDRIILESGARFAAVR